MATRRAEGALVRAIFDLPGCAAPFYVSARPLLSTSPNQVLTHAARAATRARIWPISRILVFPFYIGCISRISGYISHIAYIAYIGLYIAYIERISHISRVYRIYRVHIGDIAVISRISRVYRSSF